jgi:hypothetical protein
VATVEDSESNAAGRQLKVRDPFSWPMLVLGPTLALGFVLAALVAVSDWTDIADSKCEAGRDYLATAIELESRSVPPRYVCRLEYSGEAGSPVYPTRTVTYDAAPTSLVAVGLGAALVSYGLVVRRRLR